MKFYVATRFSNKAAAIEIRDEILRRRPHWVSTARWLEGHEESGKKSQYAAEDVADVTAADILILVTQNVAPYVHGGMHFEAGLAFGQGKVIILLGPRTNVFTHLFRQVDSLEEMFT